MTFENLKNESVEGFTLIELLVVLAIIGILAAIAIPVISEYREKAKVAATVTEIRGIETAVYAYLAGEGDWPDDTHRAVPSGMEGQIQESLFTEETPIGGYFNWEGPNSYSYAGISIESFSGDDSLIELVDTMLDNGDTSTGRFRITGNGRPTLIIDE